MPNNRKTVDFETKIFHKGCVYLKVSDVAKALNYHKQQDFINEYPQLIKKISGIQCINEFDYNNLLSANNEALSRQWQIEITKVETLRSKVNSMINIKSLELVELCANNYLNIMVDKTGCKSPEEYIMMHEIPEEKKRILQQLMQTNEHRNKSYHDKAEYLHDKEQFDIDIIRYYGLDVQFLTGIDGNGEMNLEAYVVGKGVFYNVTDYGDYALWNTLYTNKEGDVILPWYNYNSNNTRMINLSRNNIDRDFSKYNIVENILWCIENLDVKALEDYEYSVFEYKDDTIDFCISLELLAKMIRPDAVDIVYVDGIIDAETDLYLTEFEKDKVFAEGVGEMATP